MEESISQAIFRTWTKAERVEATSGTPPRLRRAIDWALIFRVTMNTRTPPATRMTTTVVNKVTSTVSSTCSTDIRPKYSEDFGSKSMQTALGQNSARRETV